MLPIYQSTAAFFTQMQTKWASEINPVLALPTNSPSMLKNVPIVTGVNVINHKLGRTPQGWILTDINSNVQLYRSAAFNDLTLTLTSNGASTISLMVF